MLMDYNLWSPLSSSKNAIVIEHVFTDVAVVFPKLSNIDLPTALILIDYDSTLYLYINKK